MTENTMAVLRPMRDMASPATLLDSWLEQSTALLATTTLRRYRSAVQHFLDWFEQAEARPLTFADLHPITVAGYRGSLQDARATSTVNTHLCALRSWMTWLLEDGHLTSNPAARLKLVRRQEATAPRALAPAQVNALLRQAKQTRNPHRNAALLQILIQTGMRIGECVTLYWADIHLGEKRGHVRIRAGKGNKERVIPLNESARQALAEYAAPLLLSEPTLKAVAATWPRTAKTPLWQSERGTPLSLREASRMVHGLLRSCALRGLVPADATPHSLRHTFATRYLAAHPQDLVGLAQLLGHTSLDTTRIYVKLTEEELAARVDRIDLNAYGR